MDNSEAWLGDLSAVSSPWAIDQTLFIPQRYFHPDPFIPGFFRKVCEEVFTQKKTHKTDYTEKGEKKKNTSKTSLCQLFLKNLS